MSFEMDFVVEVNDCIRKIWERKSGQSQGSFHIEDSQEHDDIIDIVVDNLLTLKSARVKEFGGNDAEEPSASSKTPTKKQKLAYEAQQVTLKQGALFIAENVQDETSLESFCVAFANGCFFNSSLLEPQAVWQFENKKAAMIKAIASIEGDVLMVHFRNKRYGPSPTIAMNDLRAMVTSSSSLSIALRDLFLRQKEREPQNYITDLVSGLNTIAANSFCTDPAKSKAVVIAGESGSGKSWFAKYHLPIKHPEANFIYYEIDQQDVVDGGWEENSCTDEFLSQILKKCIQALVRRGFQGSVLFHAVCELARRNNTPRNTRATNLLEKFILKALATSEIAKEWWESASLDHPSRQTMDKLIIILDEVGKMPQVALGLVDEVRRISYGILNRGLAKQVMMVLVGSGLDGYMDKHSPVFHVESNECVQELQALKTFGTDPSKSDLITLHGPGLCAMPKICEVPLEDITKGTYSRVLATNTRMLFHGVIPILKDEKLTEGVDNLSHRRVQLGSTNINMDYAARKYITLNSLGTLWQKKRFVFEQLLGKQFLLLQQDEIASCHAAKFPAQKERIASLRGLVNESDYFEALRFGIIAADIKSTSPALRYLACKGATAPLCSQDGIAFKIVLQHHLARIAKVDHDLTCHRKDPYICVPYSLGQAWPPASTKADSHLQSQEDVETELSNRYGSGDRKDDISNIACLIEGHKEYDLVLTHSVTNVQGADVMVLRKTAEQRPVYLDLFQAKHYDTVPSASGKTMKVAFASLGVAYDKDSKTFNVTPNTGSAGYSYLGIKLFVDRLSEVFQEQIHIGHRIIVFSQKSDQMIKKPSWNDFPWQPASENNVWIWTREMLEPTISVLIPRKPHEFLNSEESEA